MNNLLNTLVLRERTKWGNVVLQNMIPPIARQFIAGEEIEDVKTYIEGVEVGVIVNKLGEHYTDPEDVEADTDEYIELIEMLSEVENACISVKPSQLGLEISQSLFESSLKDIIEKASEAGVFVWIDMEDSTTTDATLNTYYELCEEYDGNIGVCIQANLKRTSKDIEKLSNTRGAVRLVKGAYNEREEIALTSSEKIDEKYKEYMEYMMEDFEPDVAFGTHDPEMIEYARDLNDKYENEIEIQMLMGVREEAQENLSNEGFRVYRYAPYGRSWLSYFYRRMRERKENLVLAARSIFGV